MINKKRLLITGVSGLLGSNLAFCLKDQFDILGLYHSRPMHLKGILSGHVDLCVPDAIGSIVSQFKPQIVIHCAALADVDACETAQEQALAANVFATANVVKSLENTQAKLIYISTDLVYDGHKGSYCETDPVNPVNYYGQTKLKAEQEALKNDGALVLRTNFFGWGILPKRSLAQWVVEQLKANRPVQGFRDVTFSSLYTFDLAELIVKMINANLKGIYNCGSANAITKYEFLIQVAKKAGLDTRLISPASVEQFPFKAKRAKNLSLNVTKLSQALSIDLLTIGKSIDHFVLDLKKNYPSSWQDIV